MKSERMPITKYSDGWPFDPSAPFDSAQGPCSGTILKVQLIVSGIRVSMGMVFPLLFFQMIKATFLMA
ncbi:hypothetical protein ADICYQ_0864 [Cyclobacterium qasimii M12-11B]|uniref:Uncharacterized protein n=1 Tax=Cyclobacterium qasimii M12-11B TaxID=641524 RepID=S7X434_9BACT|nr:hypothetical protein ADICYQ_0864 [Cyclobacterium qasimii M12-11B]